MTPSVSTPWSAMLAGPKTVAPPGSSSFQVVKPEVELYRRVP